MYKKNDEESAKKLQAYYNLRWGLKTLDDIKIKLNIHTKYINDKLENLKIYKRGPFFYVMTYFENIDDSTICEHGYFVDRTIYNPINELQSTQIVETPMETVENPICQKP
jgi:hypothetical protein